MSHRVKFTGTTALLSTSTQKCLLLASAFSCCLRLWSCVTNGGAAALPWILLLQQLHYWIPCLHCFLFLQAAFPSFQFSLNTPPPYMAILWHIILSCCLSAAMQCQVQPSLPACKSCGSIEVVGPQHKWLMSHTVEPDYNSGSPTTTTSSTAAFTMSMYVCIIDLTCVSTMYARSQAKRIPGRLRVKPRQCFSDGWNWGWGNLGDVSCGFFCLAYTFFCMHI